MPLLFLLYRYINDQVRMYCFLSCSKMLENDTNAFESSKKVNELENLINEEMKKVQM